MSSIEICLQLIVYPTRDNLKFVRALIILAGIWLLALILASPMFIYKRLILAEIPPVLQRLGINNVSFCIEDWPLSHGRFYYSIFALCVQYLLPILIVSTAYIAIYLKLRNRLQLGATIHTHQRKAERGRRMKRTNCLLISIAIIFGVSWLPLNFFNLYADLWGTTMTKEALIVYAFCHMCGMSSACSNPLLYGWLNDNFRKEFQQLLCCLAINVSSSSNGAMRGVEGAAGGGTSSTTSTQRKRRQSISGSERRKEPATITEAKETKLLATEQKGAVETIVLSEFPLSTETSTVVKR